MTKPTAIAVLAAVSLTPCIADDNPDVSLLGASWEAVSIELKAPTLVQRGSGMGVRGGVHYNPHYRFTVAAGLDIIRTQFGQFVSVMATPRGPMLYSGQAASGFTTGAVLTRHGLTWGLGWGISF